ncbi:MAG: DNA-binding protein [Planctomycetaceae bacterium]|nr:MAG: DNA-binding protein [Planctomycetaceae bacterium]
MMTPIDMDKLGAKVAEIVTAKLANRPRLVDRHELGRILKCSVPTIERLQRKGLFPVVRLGRTVRYDVDQVVEALTAKGGGE